MTRNELFCTDFVANAFRSIAAIFGSKGVQRPISRGAQLILINSPQLAFSPMEVPELVSVKAENFDWHATRAS
jgi:hypothetical protein